MTDKTSPDAEARPRGERRARRAPTPCGVGYLAVLMRQTLYSGQKRISAVAMGTMPSKPNQRQLPEPKTTTAKSANPMMNRMIRSTPPTFTCTLRSPRPSFWPHHSQTAPSRL